MTPLFACFPVCLTFVALAIIGAIVVVLDLANRSPDDATTTPAAPEAGATLRTHWWVFPLVLVIVAVVMLLLAWYWPE